MLLFYGVYCKETARNFHPIILPHNLGTSLRLNHKIKLGVMGIDEEFQFFKFNMGSYGDFYLKKLARNFWMKISRIGPLTAHNKIKNLGVIGHKKLTFFLWEDVLVFLGERYRPL
jgi:hypothetical protein